MSPSRTPNLYRYEKPLRDLFILPFWLFVLACMVTFSLFALYRSTQLQVENAQLLNQVIAQTATSQNAPLTALQVATILQQAPYIDNIVFYPISTSEIMPNQTINWQTYFTEPYIGMSQPVYLANANNPLTNVANSSTQRNQVIGHLYLTLNLQKIRHAWLLHYLPLLAVILVWAFISIAICFKRIKPFFIRLNHLEYLSEQIVNNKIDELKIAINSEESRWVFSLALEKLIDKQQHLINQIKQLLKKNRQMSETQENYVYQNSHFQNVITHELKLSLNQVYAGLKLLNSQYASHEQKDAIALIENGSHKLDDKLNQIIYISRVEKGQIGVSVEKFDPLQLLDTIVNSLQPIAKDKGVILTQQSHYTSYILEGDTQKISLIITSLIENALKFTEVGTVTVSSQLNHLPKNLQWQVTITDTGIGISPSQQKEIFQPFFQVNPNHGSNFKEMGVGLYVIKKLLELIGGDIRVKSEINNGTTFMVTFPLIDWQKNIQYASLKDKKIAIFDPLNEYPSVVEALKATVASLKVYHHEKVLLDEILIENYPVLMFMPNVKPRKVSDITLQIRQLQTQGRMLIIYNHSPADVIKRSVLLADGVDYIQPLVVGIDDNELNEQNLIKKLGIYIS